MISTRLRLLCAFFTMAILFAGCESMGPELSKKLPLESGEPYSEMDEKDAIIFDELTGEGEDDQDDEPTAKIYPGTGQFISGRIDSKRSVTPSGKKGKYTLNFDDADLGEVAKVILSDTLKENYVINPKVGGRVTLQTTRPLTKEELIPTLEMLMRMNGVALIRDDGLYRLEPTASALAAADSPRMATKGGRLPPGYQVRIVPLRYVGVQEMQKILEPLLPQKSVVRADIARNLLMIAGTGRELENILETISIFDVDMLKGMSVGLYSLRNVDAATLIPELDKLFGEESDSPLAGIFRLVPIERLNAVMVITPQPAYLDQAQIWIDRLDSASTSASGGVQVYRVKNVSAVDLAATLNDIFSGRKSQTNIPAPTLAPGLKPKEVSGKKKRSATPRSSSRSNISLADVGEVRIIADEPNNSLVIVATAQEYDVIEKVIKRLDVVPLQVLIDANIFEVTLTDQLRYGLQWFLRHGSGVTANDKSAGGFGSSGRLRGLFGDATDLSVDTIGTASAGGLGYGFLSASDKIGVLFDALAADSKLNVISSPSLMVLNNQEATIKVGDQISLQTSATTNTSSAVVTPDNQTGNNVTSQFQQRDTGVELTIKPRVNPGGLVIMEIEQKVDTASEAPQTGGSGNPLIFQRQIKSSVAVQHGETLVLGGLISDRKNKTKSGIPILRDLPFLGPLFSSTDKTLTRTELVVLLTPRVVKNRIDARKITLEFKRKLTGIYEEEPEFEREVRELEELQSARDDYDRQGKTEAIE